MRDDIESVAYIIIFLILGNLPWMNKKRYCPNPLTRNQKSKIVNANEILD
jgi:hypothetical protein